MTRTCCPPLVFCNKSPISVSFSYDFIFLLMLERVSTSPLNLLVLLKYFDPTNKFTPVQFPRVSMIDTMHMGITEYRILFGTRDLYD